MRSSPTTQPTPPPLVAPPVERQLEPPCATPRGDGKRSLVDRVVRDIKIGGGCLILGLLVGKSSLMSVDPAVTSKLADASFLNQIAHESDRRSLVGELNEASREVTPDLFDDFSATLAFEVEPPELSSDPAAPAQPNPFETISPITTGATDSAITVESAAAIEPAANDIEHSFVTADVMTESEWSPITETDQVIETDPITETGPIPVAPNVPTSLESLAAASQTMIAPPVCDEESCQENLESLGTTLRWAESPADAYRRAAEQDKLVFLIHVSGNFEIPGFT